MIARHITSHDETGMRLLATGRDIYRTPTQTALDELALELAARCRSVVFAQQRCLDGAVISKAYPCEGRVIVDSVYFSTVDDLRRLYARAPLGEGLFFANAPRLTRAVALPSPASEELAPSASYDEFSAAVSSLFPGEDALAETLCALRTGCFPLALVGSLDAGEFSRRLYMALELIQRALPPESAAGLSFVTLSGGESPCEGVTGYTEDEDYSACAAYVHLPGGERRLRAAPSNGDYARADALLAGTLDDVMDASQADDAEAHAPAAAAPDARSASPSASDSAPVGMPGAAELERAQQTLSASLRYANSHEFRRFTAGFLRLRQQMEPQLYFRYCLMYSDYLHRLDHPMYEVYDAELAALYQTPPAGLLGEQIALTLTGYPGALRGTLRHLERAGALEQFIGGALPRMNAGDRPEDYALSLAAVRTTLVDCLPGERRGLVPGALAAAVNSSLPGAVRRVTAAALCSVRDALETLIAEEPALEEGAFDPAVSELIDRIEFKRLDEFADDTYSALAFAYSYVRQWDGQVTDKQRAVCLWGRLMSGCSEWNGCVMDGMLRLLAPMSPVNRVDFMGFVRRYFAAMCDGGLDRTQMSESVVMITMLTALRFDSQNGWRIDELGDVLDRLSCAGEGLEREFWQQVDTRVDLLPMDMLDAAHRIAGERSGHATDLPRGAERRERRPHGYDEERRPDDYYAKPDVEHRPFNDVNAPRNSGVTPRRVRDEAPRFPGDEERDRREARQRERSRNYSRSYDARLSSRPASSYSEREGDSQREGGRGTRRRSYDYDSDDPDGAGAYAQDDPRFGEMMRRYRRESSAQRHRGLSGETLMLAALLLLAAGALAFCITNFVL